MIAATHNPSSLVPDRVYKVFTQRHIDKLPVLQSLTEEQRFEMKVVASVLPFRVNEYVIEELIDWNNIPADPVFQLVFPQREMLLPSQFDLIARLVKEEADSSTKQHHINKVRQELNPHPAGQMELNVPLLEGKTLAGMQHKYPETLLFFPSQGQVCHAYCTFCFRWAQFVGDKELKFASNERDQLYRYLAQHKEISDLLITGGDPMVMKASHLQYYLEKLTLPALQHVQTVRIGTKSLTFWPHRFVTDDDADDLLRIFEHLVRSNKHVALMAHFNHWQEMDTPVVWEAIRRLRNVGVTIRSQAPLLRHINDVPKVWSELWRRQVKLGIVPYYMFVERDTGAQRYFEVPLAEAAGIYQKAIKEVSGLARTARGPSMSANPGKVEIQGVSEIQGEKVFVLRFIQARNPGWVQRPFFAQYDEKATWLDQLRPAFGASQFFYEAQMEEMSLLRQQVNNFQAL